MSKYQAPKKSKKKFKNTDTIIVNNKEINLEQINTEEFNELFKEALTLYMDGVGGDKEAVKSSLEILKILHSHNPQNHLVEAYLGCTMALIGRDAVSPIEKFKNTNGGLKLLDHAVISEPDSIEIRNMRANVCLRLPEMYFHRTSMAIEDLVNIASRYEKDDTIFEPEFYWNTLLNIGSAFKTLGYTEDANSVWDKLLSVTTDNRYEELVSIERERKVSKKGGFK